MNPCYVNRESRILGAIAAIEAEEALKEIGKDKGAEKSDNGSNANDKEK